MKKVMLLLALVAVGVEVLLAQESVCRKAGVWSDGTVWDGGVVPTAGSGCGGRWRGA